PRFNDSSLLLLAALSTLLLSGCTDALDIGHEVGQFPVVYGNDGRLDVYLHPDDRLRELARRSTVALMEEATLDTTDPQNIGLIAPCLGDEHNLCAGERFIDDPTAASCSGTLIADDLVLTAGHCIDDATCPTTRLVFNYYRDAPDSMAVITSEDVFSCAQVVVRKLDRYLDYVSFRNLHLDYAIIRLDRPATPRFAPAPVRKSREPLSNGDAVAVIGFGSGIPAKIEDGGRVYDARGNTRDYFVASTDTFGGNSGSAVYDIATYSVAGVFSRGKDDYVADPARGCNQVNRLNEDAAAEAATYVHHALDALCAKEAAPFCSRRSCGGYLEWPEELADGPRLVTAYTPYHDSWIMVTCNTDPISIRGTTPLAHGTVPMCGCGGCWVDEPAVVFAAKAGSIYPIDVDFSYEHMEGCPYEWGVYTCYFDCIVDEKPDGDLNHDGVTTPADALVAFKCYLGTEPCPADADVNLDGKVTPTDALCIFRRYLGQPSCLDHGSSHLPSTDDVRWGQQPFYPLVRVPVGEPAEYFNGYTWRGEVRISE
ncbi:MAG: trypsin-like peptidase domain-containing protein, partial [Pseudomonadota bacterium]